MLNFLCTCSLDKYSIFFANGEITRDAIHGAWPHMFCQILAENKVVRLRQVTFLVQKLSLHNRKTTP